MSIAGIDGCPAGWVMIKYKRNEYSSAVYQNFTLLINQNPDLITAFIDIPIGLSSRTHPRTIDQKLRRELIPRQATVFNAPCRESAYLDSIQEARSRNIEIEGKSLSLQTLNISPKIREVDRYLNEAQSFKLFESHPELCFKYLNQGNVLLSKKSTPEGQSVRLNILNQYEKDATQLILNFLDNYPRKDVKPDDIIDAFCLCICLKLARQNQLSFLRDQNEKDEKDIPIQIAYYDSGV